MHRKFVPLDRVTQVHLKLNAFQELVTHVLGEDRRTVVLLFCKMHRDIRVAKDLFGRVVFRIGRCDADV